jgi:predicted DCC family thiol-disulfide oxidoreductase YuxK
MNSDVTVLYDSLCPVCRSEVAFLRLAGRRNGLKLVDISAAEFRPEEFGLTMDECVGSLRGFDSIGRPLAGMDTIRAMYDAVGLGWLMRWSNIPGLSWCCDRAYELFAHFRPRFSAFKPDECAANRCRID